jgi:hypothetical protein
VWQKGIISNLYSIFVPTLFYLFSAHYSPPWICILYASYTRSLVREAGQKVLQLWKAGLRAGPGEQGRAGDIPRVGLFEFQAPTLSGSPPLAREGTTHSPSQPVGRRDQEWGRPGPVVAPSWSRGDHMSTSATLMLGHVGALQPCRDDDASHHFLLYFKN